MQVFYIPHSRCRSFTSPTHDAGLLYPALAIQVFYIPHVLMVQCRMKLSKEAACNGLALFVAYTAGRIVLCTALAL